MYTQLLPFQQTISRPVSTTGTGLHYGQKASVRLLPAPPSTGIVFLRKDLGNFQVPASWKYVARVSYATSLMRNGVLVSTTEHLLSALYAMGVDNLYVELDGIEVPILDGSALPWVELLDKAGICSVAAPRTYLQVKQPLQVIDRDRRIEVYPAGEFAVQCVIDFPHPLIGRQQLSLSITPENYRQQIAPARTFGFEAQLAQMRDQGLIRGASLENAICFTERGILNPEGLRTEDECCRHKVLDLIGDLALIGYPLLAQVKAYKAGHAMHVALVRKLLSQPEHFELVTLEAAGARPLPCAASAG